MSLEAKIMDHMKEAMKAKDSVALEALRAIKSAIILAKTEAGAGDGLSEDQEIKMLQRLVKMRKDSAEIFTTQNRPDLAEPELAQIAVIEKFLTHDDIAKLIGSSRQTVTTTLNQFEKQKLIADIKIVR